MFRRYFMIFRCNVFRCQSYLFRRYFMIFRCWGSSRTCRWPGPRHMRSLMRSEPHSWSYIMILRCQTFFSMSKLFVSTLLYDFSMLRFESHLSLAWSETYEKFDEEWASLFSSKLQLQPQGHFLMVDLKANKIFWKI